MGDIIFSTKQIDDIIKKLNIKFDKFSMNDFETGLKIELEHGTVDLNTNVTNDDIEKTAKIALAHLNEFPNYYNNEYGLPIFEKYLKYRLNK